MSSEIDMGLNEAWVNVFVKQTDLIIHGAGRENASVCRVARGSWTSHRGSGESAAHWVGWDRIDEQTGESESEFTSASPVSGLMNSSHAVTSKRGGKKQSRESKGIHIRGHEVAHSWSCVAFFRTTRGSFWSVLGVCPKCILKHVWGSSRVNDECILMKLWLRFSNEEKKKHF